MSVQLPPRQSMLDVADYLDALTASSGLLGSISLRAVSKMLRERAPKAPDGAQGAITVSAWVSAMEAAKRGDGDARFTKGGVIA